VVFADFDSERGLFPLPLEQGMVLNSGNDGRVSYAGRAERLIWTAGWPDGRRVTSRMRIDRTLGDLFPSEPNRTMGEGVFWVRPPEGAKILSFIVKNPSDVALWCQIMIGDDTAGKRFELPVGNEVTCGPISLPQTADKPVKVVIRAPVDPDVDKNRKKVVREPVFCSMQFTK
jgi:hypothetical protein